MSSTSMNLTKIPVRRPWLRRPKSLSLSKRQMHVLRRRGRVRWNYVLPFLFEVLLPQLLPSNAARTVPPD